MSMHNARPGWERAPATAAARPDAAISIVRNSDDAIEPALRFDGAVVGTFVRTAGGRVVLRKVVNPEAHMLRRPPAWAIAQAHYQRLCELGGAGVELLTRDGRRWWAPVEAFGRHAFAIRRDADVQLALPLAYWQADGPDGQQLALDDLLAAAGATATAGAGGVA